MAIEENIKKWIIIDNKIKLLNNQINELRETKNNYKNDIILELNNKNLNNATIKIGKEQLKIAENKINSPISYKFLIESLNQCLNNKNDIENIINYIKNNREFKVVKDIKRFNIN